ncbi:tetratricopeptide repeat protein [Clostridium tyrobutyricum]|uniref:tetratricopeptide repeat protein n=1 Tax=Clostridium tyrobutyricum TaxID=1519 RepID=UPI001C38B298|nr:hypothetical protein [Clostridium tyrobutyricum]MBV4429673.1 hypothetical protein [Clostridium tyrobutyricum]MBV4444918.1 hypothetical protein [Clostridium tyrobutyricum]
MNVINKILFGILAMIVIFAASAFSMYKYNQTRTFKNLASQGKQYMIQKNYDKSIEIFNRALTYKNNPSIQKNLILAKNLKQEDGKQKNISKNIQLANNSIKSYDYQNASKYLDEVLKLDPNNEEAENLKNMIEKSIQDEKMKLEYKIKLEKTVSNNIKKNNYKASSKGQNSQKQSDKEITYNQALQIVASKYPESSFKPVQEVVPMITLKKFLTDDQLNKFYIFYGHDTFDDSDFQDLILLDKKTGSISQLSPDGVIH